MDPFEEEDDTDGSSQSEGSEDSELLMDEENYFRFLGPEVHYPGPFDGPDDPRRMQLSAQECECAWAIRGLIQELPDVDDLTDFMYGQLAIVEGGNLPAAVERARQIQEFKEEYGILDTVADGLRHLQDCIDLFPTHILSFSYDHDHESYTVVFNAKGFQANLLTTPERIRTIFCSLVYYLHVCFCPDLFSIRAGTTVHVECQEYDWKQNLNVKLVRRMASELFVAYPFRISSVNCYHTSMMYNVFFSTTKKFFPAKMDTRFRVGCTAPDSLDHIYHQPTVDAANQRLILQLEKTLTLRFDNEQSFSLLRNRS